MCRTSNPNPETDDTYEVGRVRNKQEQWVDMLPSVSNTYNSTKHSTTGMQPNEAKKKDNNFEVCLNISSKATYSRRYPPLKVGSQVTVYQNPNH